MEDDDTDSTVLASVAVVSAKALRIGVLQCMGDEKDT